MKFIQLLSIAIIIFLTHSFSLHAQETTTVGGYGELHYNEPDGAAKGKLDFHRFVLYLGHTFNENLSFKSEIEIEHTKIEATETGGAEGGEVAIEQAYLDWHFNEHIGLKAGIILPPIGILNQVHEPPTFNGVERPNVETFIIPTTWRESGAGIYGTLSEGVKYQLYVVAGLKAEGFSGSQGIREGRQEALESTPTNPSLTGRIDYVPLPQLKFGGSFFTGNTTGGVDSLGEGNVEILSADAQYTFDQLSLRGLLAFIAIHDVEKINHSFNQNVADAMNGGYVEAAYNILPLFIAETNSSLSVFGRWERYNTQLRVTGFNENTLYDRSEITIGATFKPTYNTAFKIDYQFFNNAADVNTKQFNAGIAYSF